MRFRLFIAGQPINQSTNQPVNLPPDQPVNLSTYQPIKFSTSQPINQSTYQLVNLSTSQPINQSTHQPVNLSTCQVINQSSSEDLNRRNWHQHGDVSNGIQELAFFILAFEYQVIAFICLHCGLPAFFVDRVN
ncbi:hypothetical protein EXU57_06585 [Segetibacter sp. 3557_3]|nr:hypothetical protein EXU57_06585 [Segetibacter sp. 3557_3]